MEELRSTDVLDSEIRSDSRKKAERLIVKAEENAKSLLQGVEQRIVEAEKEARDKSNERIADYEKNVNASLPLEKQRYLVSYIHDSVIEGINRYFDSLSAEKRLDIVRQLVERSKNILSEKKLNAVVIGFDKASAEKMLKDELGDKIVSVTEGSDVLLADEAVKGLKVREGVILSSTDGKIKCRLTLDEKVRDVMDVYNFELSSTLFGGRLPE